MLDSSEKNRKQFGIERNKAIEAYVAGSKVLAGCCSTLAEFGFGAFRLD